jgi:GH25 family lysozyme M1 (1,4-beta-N-acetylmuramidase)
VSNRSHDVTQVTSARWSGVRLRMLALLPLLLVVLPLVPKAEAASSLQGVDVSKYQHDSGKAINWSAVRRSGVSFAFIKATGGSNRVDPWFAREWAAAGRAGMIRGAYHYANPAGSAVDQANLVVSTVGSTREANDLGIVLDLESNGGLGPAALSRWAHTFLRTVEARTGRLPIIYTYVSFWHTKMRDDRSFGAYPLWLARYGQRPAPLPGWNRWTFWQHTSSGRVSGIEGDVDRNVMCCSAATLRALADGRSTRITRVWRSLGGASGTLGLPLGMESAVPGGWAQVFEHGYVVSTAKGTFPVVGGTWSRYQATGAATGSLGLPLAAQVDLGKGATSQRFARGRIVWSQATGAHALSGDLEQRWLTDGAAYAPEGMPTSEATATTQQFVGGGLYRTPSGVHLVPGPIRDKYEELGGATGALGLPLGEAHEVLGGRAVDFQLQSLYELQVGGQSVVV